MSQWEIEWCGTAIGDWFQSGVDAPIIDEFTTKAMDYFRHQIENILVSHHIKNNYRMQETSWKSTYRFNVRQWLNEVCNCKCKQEDDQLEWIGDTKKL